MVKQVIDVNFLTSLPQERLHVSQYDFGERMFEFHAYVGDDVWIVPEGSTIMLNGHKPSDPPTTFFVPCTFTDNVIVCDCKKTMTDVFGLVECELMVTTTSGLIQSTNIVLDVEKAPVQSGDIPSSDYEAIQTMIGTAGTDAARAEVGAATATEKAQEAAQAAETAASIVDSKISTYNTETVQPALTSLEADLDALESEFDTLVKYTDVTRATNVTSEQTKAVDAVELNPSVTDTLAYKLARRVEIKVQDKSSLTPIQLDALADNGSIVAVPNMKLADSVLPNMVSNALYYKNDAGFGSGIIFGEEGALLLRKNNGRYFHERFNTRIKSFNVPSIPCAGFVTSSQKNLVFFIPYPTVAGGTPTLTDLSIVVRHVAGGYAYARSGRSGTVYTPLGTAETEVWVDGAAARDNEISEDIEVTIIDGVGINVSINFVYALTKGSGSSAGSILNNIPVSVVATAVGTIA